MGLACCAFFCSRFAVAILGRAHSLLTNLPKASKAGYEVLFLYGGPERVFVTK